MRARVSLAAVVFIYIAQCLTTDGRILSSARALSGGSTAVWRCWTALGANPCNNTLYDVSVLPTGEEWAVGSGGTIIHRDGSTWHDNSIPDSGDLYAVDMVSPSNGWAAGESGRLLHWNGSEWSMTSGDSGSAIQSISMLDTVHGWAVGNGGVIMQWDGRDWSRTTSPITSTLMSVAVVDKENAWAVGGEDIVRWDGSSWRIAPHPAAELWSFRFSDIDMISRDEGWVVGSGGILHWNGTSWVVPAGEPGFDLISVEAIARDNIWAVGRSGRVMHWDGNSWILGEVSIVDRNLNDIASQGTSRITTVGEQGVILSRSLGDRGDIHQGWQEISDTVPARIAKRMDFVGPKEGWFIGDGWNRAARLVDSTWTTYNLPTSSVFDIDMTAKDDGWIVGEELVHWNGVEWKSHPASPGSSALSVSMLSPRSGWVVGGRGLILRWDGSTWNETASPVTSTLTSVSVVDASNAWAVGNDYDSQGDVIRGVILHWNGSQWSRQSAKAGVELVGVELSDVVMRTKDSGWIVGKDMILQWDGASWIRQATPTSVNLYAADFASDTSGWAVGCDDSDDMGAILKWDGVAWTSFASPVNGCPISDVAVTAQGSAWAVGAWNQTFLRYESASLSPLYLPLLWR